MTQRGPTSQLRYTSCHIKKVHGNEMKILQALVCFQVNQQSPAGQQATGGDVEESNSSGNSQNPGERKGETI